MSLINPLARAKGHGSAKSGTRHWWRQRLSSLLLIPLVIWLVFAATRLGGSDYRQAVAFIATPHHFAVASLLVVALFYHTKLGLQVVVEDYVHTRWLEITLQLAIKLFSLLGMLIGLVALMTIAFGD